MAEDKTTKVDKDAEVVDTSASVYKESDDHVPDATHQFGTLDTSGTAGGHHEKIEQISPIFDAARAQDLQYAARAVDPDDHEVKESSAVSVSTGAQIVAGDPDADRERVRKAAASYAKDPVPVADPSKVSADEEAKETKDGSAKAAKAEEQQKQASPAGPAK